MPNILHNNDLQDFKIAAQRCFYVAFSANLFYNNELTELVEMTKKTVTIKTAIERTIERLGIARQLKETNAVLVFSEVVGEKIAERATAVGIENGKLFVQVSSPVWRQELTYQKEEIIEALNQRLGEKIVREIQFTG